MAMPSPRVPDEELRCPGGLLGILKDGLLEIKCRHWNCTRNGQITYHYFDPLTGQLVDTIGYKDPMNKEK
jgi:hypothetical protein